MRGPSADPSAVLPAACVAATPRVRSAARTSRLEVRIEGAPREAYLRSFLVKARLERLGRIAAEPAPDVLRDEDRPFVYGDGGERGGSRGARRRGRRGRGPRPRPVTPSSAAERPPADGGVREVPAVHTEEVVRVSVEKLDTLLNLVGELVIQNSGFSATTHALQQAQGGSALLAELEEKTEALSAITRQLQDGIMKARMLPIASVFNRFRRVVRDLAQVSGKTVTLEVSGEETEIDKKVIDRIGEPLVHLVRNAVDHGLEPAVERTAARQERGRNVRLAASQEGDHICIEVSDDGRGLDGTRSSPRRWRAGWSGPRTSGAVGTERILDFIFLPGFSTARTVTDISGRGVGMDVVKRAIEDMGGASACTPLPAGARS